VELSAEVVGSLLTGRPVADLAADEVPEDLRAADRAQLHAEARIRANREFLTPFLRARDEVVAAINQTRSHLVIGEPGVGKRTLVLSHFRRAFPQGRVVVVDCSTLEEDTAGSGDELSRRLMAGVEDRACLLLLAAINTLTPVGRLRRHSRR
jgi:predicted ATP-dependent serine protease